MKKLILFFFFLTSYAFGAYEGVIGIEYDVNNKKEIVGESYYLSDDEEFRTLGVNLSYSSEISDELKSSARELALDLARGCADSAIPCKINLEVVVENGSPKLISK
ncbi:hypothetical protein [Helicobacter cinaedi]|uniref:hypothetical protein n=1 Tax=Helicobacter cinaedi TaxID=213 RepID=UPI000D7CF8F0|nr:hypothetical protein [Helicobacter cinaedi]